MFWQEPKVLCGMIYISLTRPTAPLPDSLASPCGVGTIAKHAHTQRLGGTAIDRMSSTTERDCLLRKKTAPSASTFPESG